MYCQVCSAQNPDDREYCGRCQHKLMVVSGLWDDDEPPIFEGNPEEQLSFDEHLLERISILEEVVRRTTETTRQVLGTLHKLEKKLLVNQTGITSLRDLLEAKRVIAREEWSELWESRLDGQLLALEKREAFLAVRDRMEVLYRGEARDVFLRRLDEAEHALLAFDIEGAVTSFEEAHTLDPRNPELSFFLGETSFNAGDATRALAYFERVLAERPDHFESLIYSGVLRHERDEAEAAEALLVQAVALRPTSFLPTFSLGAIYAGQGRLDEAIRHLERAVDIEPVPQALYLLGSCCRQRGRSNTAIRHLEAAIEQDPAFEDALFLLGLTCLDRRWYHKAIDAFRRAQRLSPKNLGFDELLPLIRSKHADGKARPKDAAQPDLSDEAAGCLRAAEDARTGGQLRQALSLYRRALVHAPDDPHLLVTYAMVCLELDRADEIQSVVDKVLGLEPNDRLKATAYTTLIEALRTEGRYNEGNRIGRLLLTEGCSDFARTLAYYEMAFNHAELDEDLDAALRYARSSLEASPEELRRLPLAALGWVHYKRQEFSQAVDCLTRASELSPSPQILTHLGMALLATGARDEARDVLTRARGLDQRAVPLGDQVIECLRDSTRLLQDLRGKPRK